MTRPHPAECAGGRSAQPAPGNVVPLAQLGTAEGARAPTVLRGVGGHNVIKGF